MGQDAHPGANAAFLAVNTCVSAFFFVLFFLGGTEAG
jgi:hypothetical protein